MFTPPKNIIGLGSSVLHSLIQANTYPAARSCWTLLRRQTPLAEETLCSHV
jgi:hypothetical protein